MSMDSLIVDFMKLIQFSGLVGFSKGVSWVFEPIVIALVSLIIALIVYFKKSKKPAVFFAFNILITGLLIKVLKEIFQRARPVDALINESGFSFPSGHTTIAVVFFGLIAYLFVSRKYRLQAILVAFVLTLLVGFTRIYLRVHWLTDVLGGLVLGSIILILSIIIYRKL